MILGFFTIYKDDVTSECKSKVSDSNVNVFYNYGTLKNYI